MPGNPEFGRRIRQLREKKKLTDTRFTLRQFAVALDLSATFISKMETGEYAPPSPEKIKKMAELLEVDADELLALAGKVDPELNEIIRKQPKMLPDFLRSVRGKSAEELKKIIEETQKKHKE